LHVRYERRVELRVSRFRGRKENRNLHTSDLGPAEVEKQPFRGGAFGPRHRGRGRCGTTAFSPYAPTATRQYILGGGGGACGNHTLAPTELATSNSLVLNSNGRQLQILCWSLRASRHRAAPSIDSIWMTRSPIAAAEPIAVSYCLKAFCQT
jgi:hypothetical protein